jgi:UDP-N-acetylglucosamine--N-acetylmuramyl-(pentapeptide) pyrophosphoryl-undecaprenol N-acetylglucosamine transferase
MIKSILMNILVLISIMRKFQSRRPEFVIGAGGYVCGPTLLAAKLLGIPVFIIEQNAVLGLTNRLLSYVANLVFLHFQQTQGLSSVLQKKARVVGNPIRQSIKYCPPSPISLPLKVLIFGGSLGATQINRMIDEWMKTAKDVLVVHQTGSDEDNCSEFPHKKYKYLDNIQEYYNWCDVIVCRAGASTVAELRVVGKPAFLIPYPQATDNHQQWNAKNFQAEVSFDVDIVDSKISDSELIEKFRSFISKAQAGQLVAAATPPKLRDAGEAIWEEIIRYVRAFKKN